MHPVSPSLAVAHPWYTHRWPWLLMIGPVLVIVAGSFAGWLAFSRPDALVVDDYYKQGKAINMDLRRDRAASARHLSVEARYNPALGTLEGVMRSAAQPLVTPFRIYLAHPTQPDKDLRLEVTPNAEGRFSVALPMLERAHWQVVVEDEARDWRLARSWSWPQQQALEIAADVVQVPQ